MSAPGPRPGGAMERAKNRFERMLRFFPVEKTPPPDPLADATGINFRLRQVAFMQIGAILAFVIAFDLALFFRTNWTQEDFTNLFLSEALVLGSAVLLKYGYWISMENFRRKQEQSPASGPPGFIYIIMSLALLGFSAFVFGVTLLFLALILLPAVCAVLFRARWLLWATVVGAVSLEVWYVSGSGTVTLDTFNFVQAIAIAGALFLFVELGDSAITFQRSWEGVSGGRPPNPEKIEATTPLFPWKIDAGWSEDAGLLSEGMEVYLFHLAGILILTAAWVLGLIYGRHLLVDAEGPIGESLEARSGLIFIPPLVILLVAIYIYRRLPQDWWRPGTRKEVDRLLGEADGSREPRRVDSTEGWSAWDAEKWVESEAGEDGDSSWESY